MSALDLLERIVASHIVLFGSADIVGVDAGLMREAIDLIREVRRENPEPV